MLQQSFPRFWWLGNRRYFLYFIREITGPMIAAYSIYFLVSYFINPNFFVQNAQTRFFEIATWIAFIASLIHMFTWFVVTGKLFAPKNKPWLSWFMTAGLIVLWLLVTSFILYNEHFYVFTSI